MLDAAFKKLGFDIFYSFPVKEIHSYPFNVCSFFSHTILIGNTSYLWNLFIQKYELSTQLQNSNHPLDDYTMDSVTQIMDRFSRGYQVYFSHIKYDDYIPIVQIAEKAGFCQKTENHLAIHSKWGPWFSLRALIFCDLEYFSKIPDKPKKISPDNILELPKSYDIDHWQQWYKIRSQIPLGKQYEFGKNQLHYHYTKFKKYLLRD